MPTSTPPAIYYFDNIAVNGAVTPGFTVKPANSKPALILNKTFKVGTKLTSNRGTWVGSGSVSYN